MTKFPTKQIYRPYGLTQEVEDKIIEAIGQGLGTREVADAAGVGRTSLNTWYRKGKDPDAHPVLKAFVARADRAASGVGDGPADDAGPEALFPVPGLVEDTLPVVVFDGAAVRTYLLPRSVEAMLIELAGSVA